MSVTLTQADLQFLFKMLKSYWNDEDDDPPRNWRGDLADWMEGILRKGLDIPPEGFTAKAV